MIDEIQATRVATVNAYLDELWLAPKKLDSLMVEVGISLTSPEAGSIRRAVWACARTTRKMKTDERNTMFARRTRLQYPLYPGRAKYRKPVVINAASVLAIAENSTYIRITELHAPNLRRNRNPNRRQDMRICVEFLAKVIIKFLESAD